MKGKLWIFVIALAATLFVLPATSASAGTKAPKCNGCGNNMEFAKINESGYCEWICTYVACMECNKPVNIENHEHNCGICTYCGEEMNGSHSRSMEVARVEPTCNLNGKYAAYFCDKCKNLIIDDETSPNNGKLVGNTDELVIPAGHDYGALIQEIKGEYCNEKTVAAHYQCSRCHKYFDSNKAEVSLEALQSPGTKHNTEMYHKKSATCTKDGNISYALCKDCGMIRGGDGIIYSSLDDVIIKAGHKYGDPTYDWNGSSCTAIHTCTVCDDGTEGHTETETVEGAYVKDTDATCVDPEKGHYTATFTLNGFEVQNTEANSVLSGDPLGHIYGEVSYVWNGSSCMATCVCTVCAEGTQGHTETETVEGTYVKDSDATYDAPEKGHYTVTFTKDCFAAQETEANSVENGKPLEKKSEDYPMAVIVAKKTAEETTGEDQSSADTSEASKTEDGKAEEGKQEDGKTEDEKAKDSKNEDGKTEEGNNGEKEIPADKYKKDTSVKDVEISDNIEKIGRRAFKYCEDLKTVSFGNNISLIGRSAFYGCSSLEEVMLDDNVKTVGSYVFKKCTSLKSFSFGNGVNTLGRSIFSGCTSLEEVTIPASVKKMGKNMFYGCSSLKSITIMTTKLNKSNLASDVFYNIPADTVIFVPAEVLDSYKQLFAAKGLNKKVQVVAVAD